MKENSTHITIVLDKSGSMSDVLTDTIGGFNTFLKDQKETPGEATLTLVQFSADYAVTQKAAPIKSVPELNTVTYRPGGMTALLDATGRAINETGASIAAIPEADRPSKVIIVIMTDGHENSSHEFSREKIFEMITHQREKYGWEVAFIGANQDAIATGATLGIASASSLNYAATGQGTQDAFATLSNSTRSYRVDPNAKAGKLFAPKDSGHPVAPSKR